MYSRPDTAACRKKGGHGWGKPASGNEGFGWKSAGNSTDALHARESVYEPLSSIADVSRVDRSDHESPSAGSSPMPTRSGAKRKMEFPNDSAKRSSRGPRVGLFAIIRQQSGTVLLVQVEDASRAHVWRAKARNKQTFAPSWVDRQGVPREIKSASSSAEIVDPSKHDEICGGFELHRAGLPADIRAVVRRDGLVMESFPSD